ncbi:pimeloyl-ACP methyl ester carboxylesterase [Fluviicoccus keumensis]|uniref:Pimeloyl-ACP methyl ester carboxylesterase n=1 Tax=Fluviicoccus keumensis TaxID=1435465 RepID=A0A4Q7Z6A8_9GAMM|nr:alpha/beta hydrolase [Fluviicoccus keumensis]RZU45273.1 pimeloyl-ACP methyl ester carboxylesterase [Fluviicoccus keumensis]
MSRTIVMIHGMWGTHANWRKYRDFFEGRGYTCVVPDLRHHDVPPDAPPPAGLGDTGIEDYVDDLEALIRAMPEPPVIMGHSMGGLIAQLLAERGLGKAIVLMTPASPAGINALKLSVIRSTMSIQSSWGFWKKPMRITFQEACYGILNLLPPAEQQQAYAAFVHESGRAAFEIGYWPFDINRSTSINAAKVKQPMLVVAATEDRMTPAVVVHKVAEKYGKNATYMEFAGHSHWILEEQGWEAVAGAVESWVSRHAD